MPTQHALLSASSSSRWMNCPPSVRLSETFENKSSPYAAQGTDAHTLSEYKLEKCLGNHPEYPKLEYYDEEMEACTSSYATFVMKELAKAKEVAHDPLVIVEQRLDFSCWVPDGFGTGDCLIISDGILSVIDMKFGLGVLVEAENNPQMMCYALGALELFDGIYDIKEIKMTIFQPRRENVSSYTLSKEELLDWANEELKPKAALAYKGEGEFQCGKWCGFCPAKNVCKARADYHLELARMEFREANLLTDEEIEEVLTKIDTLVSWAKDIQDYAFKEALNGKSWQGYKLVEGRATRKYSDEEQVAQRLLNEGLSPYEPKLLGITAMSKLLGKAKFETLLGDLIIKPQGKPTLVSSTDKRQAIERQTAQEEFKTMEDK